MMTGAMPVGSASKLPVAAGTGASLQAGKDAGAPAVGQFAAVLQQRSAAAREDDQPAPVKRPEARSQEPKKAQANDTSATPVSTVVPPVAAAFPVGLPVPQTTVSVADEVSSESGHSGQQAGTVAGLLQGNAVNDQGGSGIAADGSVVTAKTDSVNADGETPEANNKAPEGTSAGKPELNGAPAPELELLPKPATTAPAVLGGLHSAESLASAAQAPPIAPALPSRATGSKRDAPVATKSVVSNVASGAQRIATGVAPAQSGHGDGEGAAGARPGLTGENGRGQQEARSERHPGNPGSDGQDRAKDAGANAGAAPAQPTVSTNQAGSAAPSASLAVPVSAGSSAAAVSSGASLQAAPATGSAEVRAPGAAARTAAGSADVAEAAPLTAVGAARLLKTAAGSELRVGTQSADLGAVTIRTVLGREQMQAHISVENERMGSAIETHLATLGSALGDRLGQTLGVRTSVTLSAEMNSGQSGGGAARDGSAGQTAGTGSGGGGTRDNAGSGPGRQAVMVAGFGANSSAASMEAGRPVLYANATATEGRLDVRV